MKLIPLALAAAIALSPLRALNRGDSLQAVLLEKGKPLSRAEAGAMVILNYSDCSVQLRDDQVVAINTKSQAQGPLTHSVIPPTPVQLVVAQQTNSESDEDVGEWSTDLRASMAQAQSQHKHVFLFFTGSDWCGWCKRLNREILSTSDFQKYASDKLVLVKLDFPRHHPQSAEVTQQNHELAAQYQIEGYPTVIVLDSSGRPVGKLGYQRGGPGPFIQALERL
ncbi:MAG TPA: thioredoxin family protein [Opitutaceae bacterium]